MNNPNDRAVHSDGAWTSSDRQPPVPDTSMLPGAEKPPAPGADLMKRVVQGAHQTIDRLADGAAPTVRRLGEGVSVVEDALHAGTEQLRMKRDDWTEGLRGRVRSNPLACVAAALALGAMIARIVR